LKWKNIKYDNEWVAGIVVGNNNLVYASIANISLDGTTTSVIDDYGAEQTSYNTGGEASVLIDQGGTVYVATVQWIEGCCIGYSGLIAFDQQGQEKWRTDYSLINGTFSAPAIGSSAESIYIASNVAIYSISNMGEFRWSVMLTGGHLIEPIAIDAEDVIYYAHGYEGIGAISQDGRNIWNYKSDEIYWSSPVVGANGIIYSKTLTKLNALDANGALVWETDIAEPGAGHPDPSLAIASDGTIYLGEHDKKSDNGSLTAVNTDGTIKWRVPIESKSREVSSPTVDANGIIFIGADWLYAITDKGSIKWRFELEGGISTDIAIGKEGTLYFGTDKGHVYAIGEAGDEKF
jgi:sugar lactone lactonase YvrE